MTKAVIKILVLLSLFPFLISCGGGGARDKEGNDILSVMIYDDARLPDGVDSVDDNRWTRLIKEKMLEEGINVDFKARSRAATSNVIMMATGQAPDITLIRQRMLFSKFASDGGLMDLTPLIEEYGPNIKEMIDEDFLELGVIDGTQYAIPVRHDSRERQYLTLIRKDWLDALAMEVPTNRDELVNVLRAFKEKDPGNIGSENVIPWGLFETNPGTVFEPDFKLFDLMYSFMDNDLEKNISSTWPNREGFKEFMEWVHQLYQNDLLDKEFATLSNGDSLTKIINGQVGFFSVASDGLYTDTGIIARIKENNPDIEYMPINVFQNEKGEYPKVKPRPAAIYVMIPKKAKNPVAAMRYLNWLLDDETRQWMNYGFEGEHYKVVDGKKQVLDHEYNLDDFLYIRSHMRILGPYPEDEQDFAEFERQSIATDFGGMEELAVEVLDTDPFPVVLYTEDMPMMNKHGSGLIKICEKYWVKIITEENFETNFNEMMDKLKDRNIELIDQERLEYYQRHK